MFSCARPFASEPKGKRASPVDRQEPAGRPPGDHQELRREAVCDSTAVGTHTLKRVRNSTTVGKRICDPTAVGTQTLKRVCDSTAVGTHVVRNCICIATNAFTPCGGPVCLPRLVVHFVYPIWWSIVFTPFGGPVCLPRLVVHFVYPFGGPLCLPRLVVHCAYPIWWSIVFTPSWAGLSWAELS